MPLTAVQGWKTFTDANSSLAIVWDSAPTAGNLLVIVQSGDNYTTPPSGWEQLAGTENYVGLYMIWRIAGDGGTTNDSPTVGFATDGVVAACKEWSGNTATPADVGAGANSAGVAGTGAQTSGTTGTTAQADELAIAAHASSGNGNVTTWSGHTASFVEQVDFGILFDSGNYSGLSISELVLTGTQTVTCSAAPSVSAVRHGVVGTFMAAEEGGGGTATVGRLLLLGVG